MSQLQEISPTISLGKGCTMRFFVDHSKPLNSIDHCWHEAFYDGKSDSDILQIFGHWHKHHDEYLEVLQGRIAITLEGKTTVVGVGEPPLHVPRWKVHGFTVFKGEPATLKERMDPAGEFKELFFRDLFQAGKPSFLLAMRAFYDGDTYLALPGNVKIIDQAFITLVGGFAKTIVANKPAKLEREFGNPDSRGQGGEEEEQSSAGISSEIRKRL